MKAVAALVLAFSLALLSVAALAQGPYRSMSDPIFLLQREEVRRELKMSDEQREKLALAVRELKEKHQDELKKMRRLNPEQRQTFLRELSMKAAEKALDAHQVRRLKEICLQQLGPQAFEESEVQKILRLTPDQKDKIKQLAKESRERKQEILDTDKSDYEKALKDVTALAKKTTEQMVSILNPDQKKAWKGMTGAAFDLPIKSQLQRRELP